MTTKYLVPVDKVITNPNSIDCKIQYEKPTDRISADISDYTDEELENVRAKNKYFHRYPLEAYICFNCGKLILSDKTGKHDHYDIDVYDSEQNDWNFKRTVCENCYKENEESVLVERIHKVFPIIQFGMYGDIPPISEIEKEDTKQIRYTITVTVDSNVSFDELSERIENEFTDDNADVELINTEII